MPARDRVLVTGATGFVGRVLSNRLSELGYAVRCTTRNRLPNPQKERYDAITVGDMHGGTDWSTALSGVSIVFHLAARTHVLRETTRDAFATYRRTNVEATRCLAQAAVRAGVRRLVFLSSIKVNGERTLDRPFDEATTPQPEDAYGISKWEAEQALWHVTRDQGMDSVILRSPLVYGPGVKGNFLRLMHWTARGVPLPLASVDNRRSMISVGNLADALVALGTTPAAAGKTYLVSDGVDVSTPGLIRSLAAVLMVRPRLLPCPLPLLLMGATTLGKREELRRLTGSLQIDSSKIRRELAWAPRWTPAESLAQTAQWYHSQFPVKSTT